MRLNIYIRKLYGADFWIHVLLMFALAFINASALFIVTYHLGLIIDAVSTGYQKTLKLLIIIIVALITAILTGAALKFFGGKVVLRFVYRTQNKIGEKICSVRYEDIEKIKDGELLSIATKDVEGLRGWLEVLLKIGCLPAQLGLVTIYAFIVSWKFFMFSVFLIPLAAVPEGLMAKKLNDLQMNEKKIYAKVLSFFSASLEHLLVVKSFQSEKIFHEKNKKMLKEYKTARMKRHLRAQLVDVYSRIFGHVTNPLFLLVGAYFILTGEMSLGSVTNIILLAFFIGEGIKVLNEIPPNYQGGKASAQHMQMLLDLRDEEAGTDKVTVPDVTDEVPVYEVRGLNFKYEEKTVLNDVEFSIRKGEKIAVVGASGCGKTTLLKLMSGLYIPEKGKVFFNGADVTDLSPEGLRKKITTTTQEAFIFHASFKENIQIAKSDSKEDEIVKAGKHAEIDEFIGSSEKGYETVVNTTVQSISNGQMQRINLARAFLKNTDVFLLDEPTSALDADTAGKILDRLFGEYKDKTIMSIMHNMREVHRFDKILMLSEGKVIGFNTHEWLMSNCEPYVQLYSLAN